MILRNFLFHRVSEERDSLWPPMTPALFDRIIRHLARNYTVVSLEDVLSDPTQIKSKKKNATILFDDGYKDNIEVAADILQKYKCPASFYVVTDCIDKNIPTWTYLIDNAFQNTKENEIRLDMEFVPDKFKIIKKNTGSEVVVKQVKPWMKSLTNRHRLQVLNEILFQCKDVAMPDSKMMNWNDIRQLSNSGFTIGSHTHTHPMLASLTDRQEIKEELDISYQKILQEVGKTPLSISYPIGSFDERVKEIAMDSGYKFGLAVKQQFHEYNDGDLYEIPRVELYQEQWWKVIIRISGIYSTLKKVWN
jgi:peptidoglycan/xylan/chitin deacetylase (PgdA/CDA1 family)